MADDKRHIQQSLLFRFNARKEKWGKKQDSYVAVSASIDWIVFKKREILSLRRKNTLEELRT